MTENEESISVVQIQSLRDAREIFSYFLIVEGNWKMKVRDWSLIGGGEEPSGSVVLCITERYPTIRDRLTLRSPLIDKVNSG